MKRIQVKLTDKANVIVGVFKAKNGLRTKADAVIALIELAGDEQ